jgi:hypothetical protein
MSTYVNRTGATIVVRSDKYPRLELQVKPGESVVLDDETCCLTDGLTAVDSAGQT